MSTEVVSKDLPVGWVIKVEWRMDGQDTRPFYRAYRWHNVDKTARKRLWRKAQESGWKRTTIVHRHVEDTVTEINATVNAEDAGPVSN